MLRIILYVFIMSVITMFFSEDVLAKKFRIPGQEMIGTWKVISHDLSEFPQPVPAETMDGLIYHEYFLPPGQLIEITFDGIYAQPPSREVLPQYNFTTIPPISNVVCQFGIWKDALCKNGEVPAGKIVDNYFSVRIASHKPAYPLARIIGDTKTRQMRWPEASLYEYALCGDHEVLAVRILKNNKLLVMFIGGPADYPAYTGPQKGEAYQKSKGTVYSVWERVKSPAGKK